MNPKPRYLIVGDKGLTVEFGNSISEEINRQVQKLHFMLGQVHIPGLVETLPTFRSLFISYNPLEIRISDLIAEVKKIDSNLTSIPSPASRLFEIPVAYGGEYCQDLQDIARSLKLTPEEVIQIHCSREYLVYMNGFIGGTAFIKVPEQLAQLPRKRTPALWVPAGAVTLAGGIGAVVKPVGGPTGWHVIGKSPLKQWFPEKMPPLLILAGDRVRFKPIDENEYEEVKRLFDRGSYEPRILESSQ